jgi:hypothetical protein
MDVNPMRQFDSGGPEGAKGGSHIVLLGLPRSEPMFGATRTNGPALAPRRTQGRHDVPTVFRWEPGRGNRAVHSDDLSESLLRAPEPPDPRKR